MGLWRNFTRGVAVLLVCVPLCAMSQETEKDPMKIVKNGFMSFVATYDNRDYTMLTWRAAANLPHNFQYGGFINLFTSVDASQNADLGIYYTEQNIHWAFPNNIPFGLNAQYLSITGPSNDLMRFALTWEPSKTPGIKPAFDWLHLWVRINFNALEIYFAGPQPWDIQMEYLYRWEILPKAFRKRVVLSGFADQNISVGSYTGARPPLRQNTSGDNVWVTEHLLSIRLVGGLCLAGRLRHEEFLPKETGVGVGLQYVLKF